MESSDGDRMDTFSLYIKLYLYIYGCKVFKGLVVLLRIGGCVRINHDAIKR